MELGKLRPLSGILTALLLVSLLGLALYPRQGGVASAGNGVDARRQSHGRDGGGSEGNALLRHLREHLQQPRDARGWVIRARLLAEQDQFAEAADAYAKALARSPKVAADPAVWCEYADALGMAQGGTLAGRPREFIGRALALDPNYPKGLELAGSSEYERGDYAAALRYWRPLLAAQQPGSRAYAELAAAIDRSERLAAVSLRVERN